MVNTIIINALKHDDVYGTVAIQKDFLKWYVPF